VGVEQTWSPVWRLRSGAVHAQAARRDARAFASVYERHHEAIYRYCRSMLRNEEDARDALQSTMAKALAALRHEERDFDLRPWLFRIAHNEAVSRLRQRRETVHLDAANAIGADSLPQAIEDRERLALLRRDLRDLPDRQRAALVLRELCGLGHEEIAAVLDTSARAVKQTIFEARVALQECAEGRAMVCAEVQRALSDGDGRVLRARRMRAHVRSCRACRRFKAQLVQRPNDLAVLVPAAGGGGLLTQLLGGLEASGAVAGVGGGAALATKAALIAAAAVTAAGATTLAHSTPHHPRAVAPAPAPAAAAPVARATARPRPAVAPPMRIAEHRAVHRPARTHQRPKAAVVSPPPPVVASPPLSAPAAAPPQLKVPPGQAKKTAAAPTTQPAPKLPPGQAKKSDPAATAPAAATLPPGQAKKSDTATSLPLGQAKKDDAAAFVPPGQAKK
jgi:RNA polymerase sigma factor (sigma-70 family)